MKKQKIRLFSLALAFVMLLSYIPGAAVAVENATDIKAIEKPIGLSIVEHYDDYFGDGWEAQLDLPLSVNVTLANGTTVAAPVTWDTSKLDTRTTGYYSLPGTVTLPAGATNGQNLTADITIQVREYANLVANPGFEEGTKNWRLRGNSGSKYIQTDYVHSGENAFAMGEYSTNSTNNIEFWNLDQADLAARVKAMGAGQYFYGLYVRQTPNTAQDVKNFSLTLDQDAANTTVTGGKSNVLASVSDDEFQQVKGICTLTGEEAKLRLRATAVKNMTTTWDLTNLRIDDVELVPLKVALEAEPSPVKEIKTEILSHKVVLNYPDYVGANWKDALDLPKKVEIVTNNGDVADVEVTWSFAGLDFTKYGKYTLIGTLDDSSFPNPKGIVATQNIYVGKASNLLTNPSFEGDLNGWYLRGGDPNPSVVKNPVKDGSYAAMTGTLTATGKEMSFMDTRNMTTLWADIAALGGGQFYFGAWAQYAGDTPAGMQVEARLLYKTKDTGGNLSSATTVRGDKVTLVDKEYTAVSCVMDLPANIGFMESVFYLFSQNAGEIAAPMYMDQAELIPLNVTIPKDQEPADVEEILDEIPVRAVVQNYDTFVGESWQQALGLPASVKVRTSTGNIATVDVIWDYSPLNLKKEGKYTLVGALDNSAYPNPKELYVTQIIHIVEYKNLIINPGFESGINGWYLRGGDPDPSRVSSPVKSGKFAAMTGKWNVTGKETSFADTRKMGAELLAALNDVGGGQFYFGGWSQYSGKTLEGMQFNVRLLYKTVNEEGILSDKYTTLISDKADLIDKEYAQAKRVIDLPANVGHVQLVFYAFSQNAGELGAPMYLDDVELVPLNVIVEQYEGEMVQVESIIPDRQIIQNYPDYIGEGYTTKDLMLPETVEVRSSIGEIVKVGVKWDYSKLDLTKTGTYTLYGKLEDMKLANPNGLTVKQKIRVAAKSNIFNNYSFEDDLAGWGHHNNLTVKPGIVSPVRTGSFSLQLETKRMDTWTAHYLQSFYNSGESSVGQRITRTGAGRYYYSAWAQGTASSNDLTFQLRLYSRCLSTGDSLYTSVSPSVKLSTKEFTQLSNFVELPGDLYMAHLDLYFLGTPEQIRLSTIYLDDMELFPLNVEIPNLTDIIDMEEPANVYVHEGSSAEDLDLPEKLQVTIKTGQKFDLGITWNTDAFDPNKVGVQTITGSLNLVSTYKNPQEFTPTVKVTVRQKGQELRETIYFSTSGDDANDGLSPENPKQNVKQISSYLKQGYNVKLKRGDVWYLPGVGISFVDILGTEKAPLTLGAYGSGSLPTLAFQLKIENSAWKLVDAKRNIYAADVTSLGQRDGVSVHRCFVDDQAYSHKLRSNYVALEEGEYCSYDYTLYVRTSGEAPKNVAVTPIVGGHNMSFDNIQHLNVEYIQIKGGNPLSSMMYIDAPTAYLKFRYCSIIQGYCYQMSWDSRDEGIHYKPEVSNCFFDAMLTEKEGWVAYESGTEAFWNVSAIEGITMRDGVESAWIHHNHLRNMSHAFIAIESIDRANDHSTTGVRNCLIEDNVLEGVNAMYARAFNICGGFNLSDIQMCRDNTFRRNRAYDMTSSSHLFGENNLVYSNLFSFHHMTFNEDGTLFEGKQAMPGAFDTIVYSDHGSVGNMLVNNTFYNCGSAICIGDTAHTVYNNIYANNLIVNWSPDVPNYPGAFYDNSVDLNYVMNNGVYSAKGYMDHFCVDKTPFLAKDVNESKTGYSGNISADPLFVNVDLNDVEKHSRQEFVLSSASPMRYAGLSLYASTYAHFPAWERLKAEYTDINGVVYLAESPSIGAYSFCELIEGDVAEVGKLEDILARPGADFSQLPLPDAVPAVNDEGIDVVLLVDWNTDNVDLSKPGTITLTGALRNGPHTNLNVSGKTATININVKDKLELVDIVTVLKAQTVLYNTSFADAVAKLPQKLSVVEESGFEEDLPVTWVCDDYNPTKPDAYIFKCVLPEDMLTNPKEFDVEVEIRVLHEIGRGTELLVNPDFIDGTSAAPWKIGWGTGSFRVTTDPQYVYPGEPSATIVTVSGKYASIQQDVLGQMQLMGEGQYLFKVYMRAYEETRPIDGSYAALKVWGPKTYTLKCRAASDIGTDWVEFSAVMDAYDLAQATEISFHTSTGKTDEDVKDPPKSFIISGASLIYLGNTAEEVEATMDSVNLVWNTIRGGNESEKNVTSDLQLPASIGMRSTIKWTSSDESVISNDGKVTMGRVPKTVTLTAEITHGKTVTTKKFTVTVPRNPSLPTFIGSLTGNETANIGDEINFTISLKGENAEFFNAYRFSISFNTDKLEYMGISDSASTVDVDGGKITISGIGTERTLTDTFTVTFKVKKSGITEVKLVQVEMDSDPNATLEALPIMQIKNGTVTVDVARADEAQSGAGSGESGKIDPIVVVVIIIVLAALLAVTGVIVVIVIKKKKAAPSEE